MDAEIPLYHLAVDADALRHLHAALDDLDARRFQQRLPADRRWTGRPYACAGNARHPVSQTRPTQPFAGLDCLRAAIGAAAGLLHDETAIAMKLPTLKLPTLREVG